MKNIIINAINALSAGTINVLENFISGLDEIFAQNDNKNFKFIIILPVTPEYKKFVLKINAGNSTSKDNVKFIWYYEISTLKAIFRAYHYFIYLPWLCLRYKPKSLFVFGNYLPFAVRCRKNHRQQNKTLAYDDEMRHKNNDIRPQIIVLLQNAFIIDHNSYRNAKGLAKLRETIRRLLFNRTTKYADLVLVQSAYIKNALLVEYPDLKCDILPNPISRVFALKNNNNLFNKANTHQAAISMELPISSDNMINNDNINNTIQDDPTAQKKILFYPSRYYPHKNHIFIIELAKKFKEQLREINACFYVTLNPDIHAVKDLLKTITEAKIEDLVVNINEISQVELTRYYKMSYLLFFSSKTESFGNAFIEAMCFGLPIIAPDLEYARIICEDAALYYAADKLDNAFNLLNNLITDNNLYDKLSQSSLSQYKKFPTVFQWMTQIVSYL
ncbi:MAG: hypothetical protein QG673_1062 [Pseudomonadota bacterium]|nr:hypothetical protein [Pseudomonadota bacterium]